MSSRNWSSIFRKALRRTTAALTAAATLASVAAVVVAGAKPEPATPRNDQQNAQTKMMGPFVPQATSGFGRRPLDTGAQYVTQVVLMAPKGTAITQEMMELVQTNVRDTNKAYAKDTRGMQMRFAEPTWADVHHLTGDPNEVTGDEFEKLFVDPLKAHRSANPDEHQYVYYFGDVGGAGFTFTKSNVAVLVVDKYALEAPHFLGSELVSESAAATNLHEIIAHQLGYTDAPATACHGARQTGGGPHLLDRRDLVFPSTLKKGDTPVHVDAGRDNYFGHGNPDCPDLEKDKYTTGPKEIEAQFDRVAEKAWKLGVDFGDRTSSTYRANGGWVREYQDVVITHNNKYGTHVIRGEILKQWREQGGVRKLGHAMGDESRTSVEGKKGLAQRFSRHASAIAAVDSTTPLDLDKPLPSVTQTVTFTYGPGASEVRTVQPNACPGTPITVSPSLGAGR